MRQIQLIYFNAGGGHRAAAQALEELIKQERRPWRVQLVDLSVVLQPEGTFKRLTGIQPEDLYNHRLKRGWTWGMKHELKLLQGVIKLAHATLLKLLQAHWLATEPDLVVSLIPNFNRAMNESLSSTLPGVPYMTVLTDFADMPPHFWIESGLRQHIVCGTLKAYDQALEQGYEMADITLTSGMILRTEFYRLPTTTRDFRLRALGMDPTVPTGLVMFGGYGSSQMRAVAKTMADVQLIFLCGRNPSLVQALRRRQQRDHTPHAVIEYTSRVPRFMDLCDFFVGKPGPGSVSEALQRRLPVLTWVNASTLPQERYNAQWLRHEQVGVVMSSIDELREGYDLWLNDREAYASRVRAIENWAVYDVVEVMAKQLDRAAAVPSVVRDTLINVGSSSGDAFIAATSHAGDGVPKSSISSRPS